MFLEPTSIHFVHVLILTINLCKLSGIFGTLLESIMESIKGGKFDFHAPIGALVSNSSRGIYCAKYYGQGGGGMVPGKKNEK